MIHNEVGYALFLNSTNLMHLIDSLNLDMKKVMGKRWKNISKLCYKIYNLLYKSKVYSEQVMAFLSYSGCSCVHTVEFEGELSRSISLSNKSCGLR